MPSDLGATGDRPSLASPRLAALSALALRPPAGLASIDRRDSGADRHHGERGTGSGAQRIRGELLKLGIVVSSRSIRRFRRRRPSRPPSQSWRAFLANHAQAIWAADLFVVQTLTFQTLLRHLLYQSWQPPASSLRSTCAVKFSPSVASRTCPSLPDHPSSAPDPRLMDSPDSSMSARAP